MHGKLTAIIVAATLTVTMSSLAEEPAAPTIQAFELATIQSLGQHMFRQDEEAWRATDLLLAKRSPQELDAAKARGWIVDEGTQKDVVRFLREGTNGLEVAYDVSFVPGAAPVLSEPENRTLTADEIAQAAARTLALKSASFHCSNTPANTVAFRDPAGNDWLVWVMSATQDNNLMMLGGHTRFTITADGKSVLHQDALSKSCNILPRKGEDGKIPVGYFFTHIVSDTPVETHVFASLSYGVTFFVGTPDRSVWVIEKGKITKVK